MIQMERRALERKSVREFEKDGSGSSHRREATHSYHKGLTHAVWLAHGCGTGTQHWVSSPGCAAWPWARAERSTQITGNSIHDWSHSGWRLIRVDHNDPNHDIRPRREHTVKACSHAHCHECHSCCTEGAQHASLVNNWALQDFYFTFHI